MATALFNPKALIPEHLPGEPKRHPPGMIKWLLALFLRGLFLTWLFSCTAWLWIPYLLGRLLWARPPHVVHLWQVRRYLYLIWTVRPPEPGLNLRRRLWLSLSVFYKIIVWPIWGTAWYIDEWLYGHDLKAMDVRSPLIEISAGRSGSTQLARYLEDDPQLAAPSLLQFIFPYIWLWRLMPITLGRFLSKAQVQNWVERQLPPEFRERHESDVFRTDTFEGGFYIAHLQLLSPFLGPDILFEDFHFAKPAAHNLPLWEEDFVAFVDRIGRKTLLQRGPMDDGTLPRFFIKGHFLAAMPALSRRYPDARFLTMIRHPAPRFRSAINYLKANPMDPLLGSAPWAWWAEGIARAEPEYCQLEMERFTEPGPTRRTVLRFDAYVADLAGSMAKVYRECLDQDTVPDCIPREHAPRERKNYLFNRSLEELGIDRVRLDAELADYIAWCQTPKSELAAAQGSSGSADVSPKAEIAPAEDPSTSEDASAQADRAVLKD